MKRGNAQFPPFTLFFNHVLCCVRTVVNASPRSYLNDLYAQLPEPKTVWEYFLKVTQIPRGSNQEGENFRHKEILAFLKKSAEDLGLEATVIKGDNLLIRKPAHPGWRWTGSVTRRLREQVHRLPPVPHGYGLPG